MFNWKEENEVDNSYGLPPLSEVYSCAMDLDGNDGKKGCKSGNDHTDGFGYNL